MWAMMQAASATEVSYSLQRDACAALECKMTLTRLRQGQPEDHVRVNFRVPVPAGENTWASFTLTAQVDKQSTPPAQWLQLQGQQGAVQVGLQTWPGLHGAALLTLRYQGLPGRTIVQWYDGPPGALNLQAELDVSDEPERAYWVEVQPRLGINGQWALIQARFARPKGASNWQDMRLWRWAPQQVTSWQPITDAGWGVLWPEHARMPSSAEGVLIEGRLLQVDQPGRLHLRWAVDSEAAQRLEARLQTLGPDVVFQRLPLKGRAIVDVGSY